jgi:hypothetical protein
LFIKQSEKIVENIEMAKQDNPEWAIGRMLEIVRKYMSIAHHITVLDVLKKRKYMLYV